MWLSCFFPQDQQLHYEAPWSPFHLGEITPVGSINTVQATSDALLSLFKHWNSVLPYCCVPLFFFFNLVCFIMQLLGNCHKTERSQRRWSISEGTPPPPYLQTLSPRQLPDPSTSSSLQLAIIILQKSSRKRACRVISLAQLWKPH